MFFRLNCAWIARFLEVRVESIEEMCFGETDRQRVGANRTLYFYLSTVLVWFVDELCGDIVRNKRAAETAMFCRTTLLIAT